MGTWKAIEIKPNDQSLVGKKVKGPGWPNGCEMEILFVGSERFFLKDKSGNEDSRPLNFVWVIYDPTPQKQIVKMAPAFSTKSNRISHFLYSTREEAMGWEDDENLIWPAPLPDAEGYYHIEREV